MLRGRTEGKDPKPIIREPTANRAIVLPVAERAAFIGYGYLRDRDGFASVPHSMPLLMNIMDDLSGKGFPVGQVCFDMWCRLFDECFLVLKGVSAQG